jgi:hypothetical protein
VNHVHVLLVEICVVMVSPLVVPVTVTIVHAVKGWQRRYELPRLVVGRQRRAIAAA